MIIHAIVVATVGLAGAGVVLSLTVAYILTSIIILLIGNSIGEYHAYR